MDDRLAHLESEVARLSQRLEEVESALRSATLRGAPPLSSPSARSSWLAEETIDEVEDNLSGSRQGILILSLIGRTLLILGGAYLWRAATDSGLILRPVGSTLGLLYAFVWLGFAHFAAIRRRRLSAALYIATTVLVSVPLLWEATVRFGVFSAVESAVILTASALITLAIAYRSRAVELAWIHAPAAALLAIVLAVVLADVVPFTGAILALSLATLWLGYGLNRYGVTGFFAGLSDLVLILLTVGTVLEPARADALIAPEHLIYLQLGLLLSYVVSIALRTLLRRREVIAIELVQTTFALGIGLLGPLAVVVFHDVSKLPLGVTSAGLAVAFYGFAFAVIDRRAGERRNFIYYATLAITCAVIALTVNLEGPSLAISLAALTVATGHLSTRYRRVTLVGHAAIYGSAAAFTVGIPSVAFDALLGDIVALQWWRTPGVLATVVAVVLTCSLTTPSHRRTWGRLAHVPKVVLMLLCVASLLAAGVSAGAAALRLLDESLASVAVDTALGTWVLTLIVLAIAWLARFDRYREAVWLVYPLLLLNAAKLFAGDLLEGSSATLFVSFALVGIALVLVPRLLRARRRKIHVPPSPPPVRPERVAPQRSSGVPA